jgi:hypothetical protein
MVKYSRELKLTFRRLFRQFWQPVRVLTMLVLVLLGRSVSRMVENMVQSRCDEQVDSMFMGHIQDENSRGHYKRNISGSLIIFASGIRDINTIEARVVEGGMSLCSELPI